MNDDTQILPVDELVARIQSGSSLAVPRDVSGVSMAATRALVRQSVTGLHLIACPTSGLQADILIGAGCVASIEAAAVFLGEFGAAPRFANAVREGSIEIRDSTCPAIHAGLQAAEKGAPFMPLRGIIGSDVLRHRPDWTVIDNPFGDDDPIVVVPAIAPDCTLFHAETADRHGNVWIGRVRELATMAHAARTTLVTVEEIVDGDLLADERSAAGVLSSLYVDCVAHAPGGARPVGLGGRYGADEDHLREYLRAASSDEGFARYLERHVLADAAALAP
jgi:glutaconate CoA-transferase subunit A